MLQRDAGEYGLSIQESLKLLLQEVESRRGEFDELRHIPRSITELMKGAGIFRASTPRCFGGNPMPPSRFLQLVERIATVDGSAGWVAAFGSANTYLATLPYETQRTLYSSSPDQIFAGGLFPPQKGIPCEGGWMVSGQWKFASGCKGADWLGVGIHVEQEGKPPRIIMGVLPAKDVEIIDNWDVVGMQGTGSHDLRLKNQFISLDWTCDRTAASTIQEPLFRFPNLAYQAEVHCAVMLGLARAAIELIQEMAEQSKLIPGASPLAERSYVRTTLAKAEAGLRSCRGYFFEAAEAAWSAIAAGEPLPKNVHNDLHLSAAYAAQQCGDIIQDLYRIAGIGVIQRSHRLQQIARDAMVINQHAALSQGTFEAAGAILAGTKPAWPYI